MNELVLCKNCGKLVNFEEICPNCGFNLELLMPLFIISIQYYNKSLEYLQKYDIENTYFQLTQSLKYFPYSIKILEFGLFFSLSHGLYEYGLKILSFLSQNNVSVLTTKYLRLYEDAVSKWHITLDNPKNILEKYNNKELKPIYRELLLLKMIKSDDLNSQHDYWLSKYKLSDKNEIIFKKQSSVNKIIWFVSFVLLVTVLSLTSGYKYLNNKKIQTSEIVLKNRKLNKKHDDVPIQKEFTTLLSLLSEKKYRVAIDKIHLFQKDNILDTIETQYILLYLANQIYHEAMQDYRNENYKKALEKLDRIFNTPIDEEIRKSYYMGLSAYFSKNQKLTIKAFKKMLLLLNGDFPYYEAQSVYILALIDTEFNSKKYAEIIKSKYSNTVYYNSKIKRILNE